MPDYYPDINHNRYFYGLPILSETEETMLEYQLDHVPDLMGNLSLFARQTDVRGQLDTVIKRAINRHDSLTPVGINNDERDIINEGVSDGYLAVTGLFELINVRRTKRTRHHMVKPLFPLAGQSAIWTSRVQKNIVDSIDFFENDQNQDSITGQYLERSPYILDFLTSLEEKSFIQKQIESNYNLEDSYELGFTIGAEAMIVIHYLVNMEREMQKISKHLPQLPSF